MEQLQFVEKLMWWIELITGMFGHSNVLQRIRNRCLGRQQTNTAKLIMILPCLSFQSSWKGRIQESFDYCNWLVTQQIRLGDWNLRLWFFSFGILIEEASLATQTEETSRIEVHLWVYKLVL